MAENNGANGAAAPAGGEAASEGTSIKDYLDFDPFEPSDEGQAGGAEGTAKPADEPAVEAAGDALPPTNQQKPPADQSAKPTDDPVLRELARINQTLAASQQPRYTIPQQPQAPQKQAPRYNLEIPQQILKAVIHSEDPEERALGLAALINGLANTIYNDVTAEQQTAQQRMVAAIPQMHQRLSVEQNEQQRAAQDFFGRFTGLKPTPQMMGFVANEAKALAIEQWNAGNRNLMWNEQFREALGKRVYEAMGFQVPGRQQQQPQGAQRAPKRPQFAAGGDAKGGNERRAPNQETQEIWDVFGYN
jgi:hypothetical protein